MEFAHNIVCNVASHYKANLSLPYLCTGASQSSFAITQVHVWVQLTGKWNSDL